MLIYKTFQEWSTLGYTIKSGSKAFWVNDVAMFSSAQVKPFRKLKKLRFLTHWNIRGLNTGPTHHWGHLHSDDLYDYENL